MPNSLVPQEGVNKVVTDLKFEIGNIQEKIKNQGLGSVAYEQLSANRDSLQTLLNNLLMKKNVITDKEYDDAYEQLRITRKKNLQVDFYKSKNWMYIVGGIVVIAGFIYLYKRSEK